MILWRGIKCYTWPLWVLSTYRLIDLTEAIIYLQLLGFVQGLAVVFDPCILLTSILDCVVDHERGATALLWLFLRLCFLAGINGRLDRGGWVHEATSGCVGQPLTLRVEVDVDEHVAGYVVLCLIALCTSQHWVLRETPGWNRRLLHIARGGWLSTIAHLQYCNDFFRILYYN